MDRSDKENKAGVRLKHVATGESGRMGGSYLRTGSVPRARGGEGERGEKVSQCRVYVYASL